VLDEDSKGQGRYTVIASCIFASPRAVYGRRGTIGNVQSFCCTTLSANVALIYSLSHSIICQMLPFVRLVVFNVCIFYKMTHTKGDLVDLGVAKEQSKDGTMAMEMVMVVTLTFPILVARYVTMLSSGSLSVPRLNSVPL
jgi:hypothetical protein